MSVADEVFAIYERHGSSAYFGEHVSMLDHGLQAAHFAAQDGAPESLVLAALLHDIGHLLEPAPEDISDWTTDARHEETGAKWLAARFRAEIAEPVRLHVPAKRYLCATDKNYAVMLSDASVVTLNLQGGAMPTNELAQFESHPLHREAVRVRRWDDLGKIRGLKTARLDEYRQLIEEFAVRK